MDRHWAAMAALLAAGIALPGCVAVIPAVAGSAVIGTRVADRDKPNAPKPTPAPAVAAVTPAPAPTPAPPPKPAPTIVALAAPPVSIPAPRPAPAPAPKPVPVAEPAPAPAPAPAPIAVGPLVSFPDPARPLPPEQANFARFVRYAQAAAVQGVGGAELPSAVLSDQVALDGKRRRCTAGEQLVAVIDLDPAGGTFAPPANPKGQPGLAFGLSVLRQAGVEIAWLSNLSTTQSGALRTALEQSGFDPRGQDIISLSRDNADDKQKRRDNLAGITCIIAIAGDEREDFDMRYKYLRSPEAGSAIDALVGDGWFLIPPLLGE